MRFSGAVLPDEAGEMAGRESFKVGKWTRTFFFEIEAFVFGRYHALDLASA
jgi:hypothetical protein